MDSGTMFAIILSLFGGVALSINEENCDAVMCAVGIFSLISCGVLALVHFAVQSYETCRSVTQLCGMSDLISRWSSFPVHDEGIRFRAYIAAGYSFLFSLIFMLGLLPGRQRRIRWYPTIGAFALLIGGTISLVQYTGLHKV